MRSAAGIVALVTTLSGCAIHQTVTPVQRFEDKEICLIENPSVRTGFLQAYKAALSNKGYMVRQLPATAAITACRITSTYTANWSWDMAMYMSFAEIKVFDNGRPSGAALYDAKGGGANMSKFIAADKKIGELVNQLFPGGAGA